MSGHIELIFVGPEQVLPLITALVLWLCLVGLGGLFTSKDRLIEVNAIFGWSVISGIFTIVGTFVAQPFFTISCILCLLSLIGHYRSFKNSQPLLIKGMWRVLILVFPLLWIGAGMEPSQWDEFSHWLPAPKYLFEFDGFPTKVRPFFGTSMLPAYPYGWPYLTYLSSLIAGQFMSNVTSTLNIFLLLSFSTFALRTAFFVTGNKVREYISWSFASVIVLFATLLNSTFVQKIVLTAYSDVSTSVLTGFSMLVGYYFLESLANRRSTSSWSSAWQLSLVLSLLINVRQTNLVLVIAVLLALSILALKDGEIQIKNFIKHTILVSLPILIVYLTWRYYVYVEFKDIFAELALNKLESWHFSEIPQILLSMGYVSFKKIGFFGPMAIACYFGIKGLIKIRTNFDKISILAATIFLFYTAFLFLTYVGHSPKVAAISAVSFWRYSTHNGMVALAFVSCGAIYLFTCRNFENKFPDWLRFITIVFVFVLPLCFAQKIRFDLEPPKPHFTMVAKGVRNLISKETLVFVVDPMGTGESHNITNYYLNQYSTNYIAAFTDPTPANVRSSLDRVSEKNYVLVHSLIAGLSEYFGISLSEKKSYLFRRGSYSWIMIQDWTKPENHKY